MTLRYKSHNNLLRYFIEPHHQLPRSYLASCKKFFKAGREDAEMYLRQAASDKLQASSCKKQLHKVGTRVKNRFNRKV
jgi:hypothetical protein